MVRESQFQAQLIKDIRSTFVGSIVLKNDPNYLQGVPDLIVLHKNKWAALEVKDSYMAPRQPNQEYYVDLMDDMSMAAFVFPENRDSIFDELHTFFKVRR